MDVCRWMKVAESAFGDEADSWVAMVDRSGDNNAVESSVLTES